MTLDSTSDKNFVSGSYVIKIILLSPCHRANMEDMEHFGIHYLSSCKRRGEVSQRDIIQEEILVPKLVDLRVCRELC